MLWLGCPECFATWEPASSLPTSLIDQFESEAIVESSVESVPLYGHVSSTVTVAQSSAEQGPAKKKQERTSVHDSQGYVDMYTIMHGIALIIMLGLFFDISLKQDSHWSQLKVTGQSCT